MRPPSLNTFGRWAGVESLDWAVIGGYFAVILGLSWWVTTRRHETSEDYFLASHSLGWFVVGASIFASNIGSEHLVGLAGSGATDGVARRLRHGPAAPRGRHRAEGLRPDFAYETGSAWWIISKVYFQYFSLLITAVSAAAMVLVSLATRAPDPEQISGLTYGSLTDEQRAESRASWGTGDVVASGIVLALIVAAYVYFSR